MSFGERLTETSLLKSCFRKAAVPDGELQLHVFVHLRIGNTNLGQSFASAKDRSGPKPRAMTIRTIAICKMRAYSHPPTPEVSAFSTTLASSSTFALFAVDTFLIR